MALSGLLLNGALLQNAHDVALLHDQEILAIDLHLRAGPLAEQHGVAGLDVEGNELALLVAGAGADSDHIALLGLLLGGVGDDDPTCGLLLGIDTADHDPVMQRTELHEASSNGFSMLTDHAEPLRASAGDDLVGEASPFKRGVRKFWARQGAVSRTE